MSGFRTLRAQLFTRKPLELLLEEVSFQAPETASDVTVDGSYVEGRLGPLTEDREVRKYLL